MQTTSVNKCTISINALERGTRKFQPRVNIYSLNKMPEMCIEEWKY